MKNPLIGMIVIVFSLQSGQSFGADNLAPGTVTGQGSVELKRQAEVLRVRIEVLAKGKSLKEALTKLRERKLTAQKNLDSLGAAANSVEFGEAEIVDEKNDRQSQMAMRMMMRQMRNQGNKTPQKAKEAPPITVTCVLRAEFRLKPADAEEFLIAANTLEERMKAMDLGGLKALKQASAQDEELAQEEAQEMGGYDGNAPKRGEPFFFYVSKISEAEQEKARAQAFKKAKQEAEQLARAAGAELGALHTLNDSASAAAGLDGSYAMARFGAYRMRQYLEQMQEEEVSDEPRAGEAIGLKPKKVVYRVIVSAAFELKKSQKDVLKERGQDL